LDRPGFLNRAGQNRSSGWRAHAQNQTILRG